MKIRIKRVYDEPSLNDGTRILVDRLWPRGLSKDDAKVDLWLKSVAPSSELRRWYQHDAEKWIEFKRRYFAELKENQDAVTDLLFSIKGDTATFLYSSKESQFNNAVALKEYIDDAMKHNRLT